MREHYRSERHAALDVHYAACNSGPCRQGTALCPSPQACRVPERDVTGVRPGFIVALVIAVVLDALLYWGLQ